MMALFLTAKLACLWTPDGKVCRPLPQIWTIAGHLPTPTAYRLVKRAPVTVIA